jgi:glycosyltransferase involved in cell wall biosynthesis
VLVVNGRFLANRYPLGVHRAARSLLDALRARLDLEVVSPVGTTDGRADRRVWAPPGAAGLQLWEQAMLPATAGRRPLLSLAGTGPLVARRHALFVFDAANQIGPQWFRRFNTVYMDLMLAVARRATLVLTASYVVRRELIGLGVRADRLVVVPAAVDEMFRPASDMEVARVRQRYDLGRPYTMLLGWGDPRKDAATAVAAHAELVADVPHDLLLLGRPHPYFAPVHLPELTSVKRLGRVGDDDLVPLVTGASALLYPSLYEGFGLPPLEAVACGTPALVSDIEVLRETVGDAATYVPTGDLERWRAAMAAALNGDIEVGAPSTWRWDDAGDLVARAVRDRGLD